MAAWNAADKKAKKTGQRKILRDRFAAVTDNSRNARARRNDAKYESRAARQKAYRDRKKGKAR